MGNDIADVSMPDGIEVDEAAAYFGVFESSDALHQMMEMSRVDALENFFALLSDLVLKPGDFDFELASQRLSCEGGEIYFLVAGHLGMMTLPEQLSLAITEGQFSDSDATLLGEIADPMRLLKLFAIAQQTGGKGEATKYLRGVESLMSNPAANKDALLSLAQEVQAAFDVAGHVTPIASLASGSAVASEVETAYVPPAPRVEEEVVETIPVKVEPKPAKIEPEKPISVPLPTEEVVVPLPTAELAVSLPIDTLVPLPNVEEPKIEADVRKDSEKTEDAFAGAFGMVEPESVPEPVPVPVIEAEPEPEPEPEVEAEPEPEPEEESTLEDAFAAADVDNSGGLSIEEVAQATGLELEDAAKIHAQADVDGDGQVTLEELKSNPEVAEKMALPKPVKPIRAGIQTPQPVQQQQQQDAWAQQQQQQQQQEAWAQQQQQQQQQDAWAQQQQQQQQQEAWAQQQQQQQQQEAWAQQQQQQQQQEAWAQQQQQQQGAGQPVQPMQPTILSGIHCRGCRIGVDANWKFCPVCGTQNR